VAQLYAVTTLPAAAALSSDPPRPRMPASHPGAAERQSYLSIPERKDGPQLLNPDGSGCDWSMDWLWSYHQVEDCAGKSADHGGDVGAGARQRRRGVERVDWADLQGGGL